MFGLLRREGGSSGQLVGLRLREEEEVEEFGVFW